MTITLPELEEVMEGRVVRLALRKKTEKRAKQRETNETFASLTLSKHTHTSTVQALYPQEGRCSPMFHPSRSP